MNWELIKWKVDLRNITQLSERGQIAGKYEWEVKRDNQQMRSNVNLISIPKEDNKEKEGRAKFKEAVDENFLEIRKT